MKETREKKTVSLVVAVGCILLAAAMIVSAGTYFLWAAYWGNRHSVLYDVRAVHVVRDSATYSVYHLTYDVTVKNWPHDFNKHTYRLEDFLSGEPGAYDFSGKSDYFTVGRTPVSFHINVRLDMKSVYAWLPFENFPSVSDPEADNGELDRKLILHIVDLSTFMAYDRNGREERSAMLFMNDYKDAPIIFE